MKTKTEPEQPPVEIDPLRAKVTGLSPKEEQILRDRLLSCILQTTVEMCVIKLQTAAQAVDVCANSEGCVTPFEDYITSLVMRHYEHRGVTPEMAIEVLDAPDGFRANFVDFAETAKRFHATYPQQAEE